MVTTAPRRQKNYAAVRQQSLEFEVWDYVIIKVALMKGVMRFGKKRKLNPRYLGLYKVVKRIGIVAYELALPETMSTIHNTFNVSMLKKYVADPEHVIEPQAVQI